MSRPCTDPRCPCRNPAEDEVERPYVPARPRVGRPMPAGWKDRVAAELRARKEQRQNRGQA